MKYRSKTSTTKPTQKRSRCTCNIELDTINLKYSTGPVYNEKHINDMILVNELQGKSYSITIPNTFHNTVCTMPPHL